MKRITALLLFLIIACGLFAQDPAITTTELKNHISYLASDALKGRKAGSGDDLKAALYILNQFKQDGLELMGVGGMQYFEIVANVLPGKNNLLSFQGYSAKFEKDYVPFMMSESGAATKEMVFVGYGYSIDTENLKWNDYAGLDVKDKILLIFRGNPDIGKDSLFDPYDSFRSKALEAKDKGAAGVIFITPQHMEEKDILDTTATTMRENSIGIPMILVTREMADRLLSPAGRDVLTLEKRMNEAKGPASFPVPASVTVQTDIITRMAKTQNVIGILRGNDPLLKDEYIVAGAHFDHLGMGGRGSGSRVPDTIAIHNGADDNASGSALLMELAQKLSSVKGQLKRSVIFIAFDGEEEGLLGSKFFVNNPTVNLKSIKTMFNYDMVGRLDPEKNTLTVSGAGTSLEGDSILIKEAVGRSFKVNPNKGGLGGSDQTSFYSHDIPVFFFFTGIHKDYHTPTDDVEKINFPAEKEIGDYAFDVMMDVINRPQSLTFQQAASEKNASSGQGRGGMKVKLGIVPDFASTDNNGLGVDGVTPGGPADKGGIKKGDVIKAINGQQINNIYDYMSRLGKINPGSKITVEVLREGQKVTLDIQL